MSRAFFRKKQKIRKDFSLPLFRGVDLALLPVIYSYHRRPSPADAGERSRLLALVELGGVTVELLRYPYPVNMGWGSIPHFALYVSDVDEAAKRIRAAGVDSFTAPEKNVDPRLFGGLENWFFTGPSGEIIELLKMYE